MVLPFIDEFEAEYTGRNPDGTRRPLGEKQFRPPEQPGTGNADYETALAQRNAGDLTPGQQQTPSWILEVAPATGLAAQAVEKKALSVPERWIGADVTGIRAKAERAALDTERATRDFTPAQKTAVKIGETATDLAIKAPMFAGVGRLIQPAIAATGITAASPLLARIGSHALKTGLEMGTVDAAMTPEAPGQAFLGGLKGGAMLGAAGEAVAPLTARLASRPILQRVARGAAGAATMGGLTAGGAIAGGQSLSDAAPDIAAQALTGAVMEGVLASPSATPQERPTLGATTTETRTPGGRTFPRPGNVIRPEIEDRTARPSLGTPEVVQGAPQEGAPIAPVSPMASELTPERPPLPETPNLTGSGMRRNAAMPDAPPVIGNPLDRLGQAVVAERIERRPVLDAMKLRAEQLAAESAVAPVNSQWNDQPINASRVPRPQFSAPDPQHPTRPMRRQSKPWVEPAPRPALEPVTRPVEPIDAVTGERPALPVSDPVTAIMEAGKRRELETPVVPVEAKAKRARKGKKANGENGLAGVGAEIAPASAGVAPGEVGAIAGQGGSGALGATQAPEAVAPNPVQQVMGLDAEGRPVGRPLAQMPVEQPVAPVDPVVEVSKAKKERVQQVEQSASDDVQLSGEKEFVHKRKGWSFPKDSGLLDLVVLAKKKLGKDYAGVVVNTYGGSIPASQVEVLRYKHGFNGTEKVIHAAYRVSEPDAVNARRILKGSKVQPVAEVQPTSQQESEVIPNGQNEAEKGRREVLAPTAEQPGAGEVGTAPVEGKRELWQMMKGEVGSSWNLAAHGKQVKLAVLDNKPVPRAVLEDYRGQKWADDALAKLESSVQPAPESGQVAPDVSKKGGDLDAQPIDKTASNGGVKPIEKPSIDSAIAAIRAAYATLRKSSNGFADLAIADVRDEAGLTQEQMDAALKKMSSEGGAVLGLGEPIYADEHKQGGAVEILGQKNLLVRVMEEAKGEKLNVRLVPVLKDGKWTKEYEFRTPGEKVIAGPFASKEEAFSSIPDGYQLDPSSAIKPAEPPTSVDEVAAGKVAEEVPPEVVAAKKRIGKAMRGETLNAMVPGDVMADLVTIGKYYLGKGLKDFKSWTEANVAYYADRGWETQQYIRRHAQEIWDAMHSAIASEAKETPADAMTAQPEDMLAGDEKSNGAQSTSDSVAIEPKQAENEGKTGEYDANSAPIENEKPRRNPQRAELDREAKRKGTVPPVPPNGKTAGGGEDGEFSHDPGDEFYDTTAAKNAKTTADLHAINREQMPSPDQKSYGEALDEAVATGVPRRARQIVEEIMENPRNLSYVEEAGLNIYAQGLKNDHSEQMKIVRDPSSSPEARYDAQIIANRLLEDFTDTERAKNMAGTEWGRAGVGRKMTIDKSFELVPILAEAEITKNEILGTKDHKPASESVPLTAKERADFEQLVKSHDESLKKIERLEKEHRDTLLEDHIAEVKRKAKANRKTASAEAEAENKKSFIERARKLLRAGCLR